MKIWGTSKTIMTRCYFWTSQAGLLKIHWGEIRLLGPWKYTKNLSFNHEGNENALAWIRGSVYLSQGNPKLQGVGWNCTPVQLHTRQWMYLNARICVLSFGMGPCSFQEPQVRFWDTLPTDAVVYFLLIPLKSHEFVICMVLLRFVGTGMDTVKSCNTCRFSRRRCFMRLF